MPPVHYRLTLEEHRAERGSYVDPARYQEGNRDYRPEMLCHTGDGHAQGTRSLSAVTCPACLVLIGRAAAAKIASVSEGQHIGDATTTKPGALLTMEDGSQWFHPYDGGAPVKTRSAAEAPAKVRHEWHVLDLRTGLQVARYPVDVSPLAAKAAADKCRELSREQGPHFQLLEIGAPDQPGQFERCRLAGYRVEPDGFGAWIARDPDGVEIEHGPTDRSWPTERTAWEACDHHRMFGDDPMHLRGSCEDPRLMAAGYTVCGSNGDREWHWRPPGGPWHDGHRSEGAAVNAALRHLEEVAR